MTIGYIWRTLWERMPAHYDNVTGILKMSEVLSVIMFIQYVQ